MTYNILCGGLPMPGAAARHDAIAAVIRAANPDIVALQECVGFEAPGAMENWAERLGLQYNILGVVAPYEDGYCYNVTVFSRFFLQKTAELRQKPFQTGGVFVRANTPLGNMEICNLHLHAFNEDERIAEVKAVLSTQAASASRILLGDFNAISARDSYPLETPEFERRFDAVSAIEAAGFVDLGAGAGMTHPSPAKADHDRKMPRRIDYVFASADIAAHPHNARVIRGGQADVASDHYPVVVDIG